MLHIATNHARRQRRAQEAHVGHVDKAESLVGGDHHIAQVQRAEVHAGAVQLADQFDQARQVGVPVEAVIARHLQQGAPWQWAIQHGGAAWQVELVLADHFESGNAQLRQARGVVDEALRVRAQQCR
ncbi:hypothetical protein D3C81_1917760 [compost metagenome]